MNSLSVTSSPHLRDKATIEKIMLDVIIALIPATIAGIFFFGIRAALIIALCVSSCVVFEAFYQKVTKQEVTVSDFSAVVTGLLLALTLPSTVPWWLPIVGSFFAIVIVKQLFGGLGQNFVNPALAARAFLQISYPIFINAVAIPVTNGGDLISSIFPPDSVTTATPLLPDAITTATPLGMLKEVGATPQASDYLNALFGNTAGAIGETCAIALIAGGIYLLVRKVINWRIPVMYILSFGILTFIFGRNGLFTGLPVYEILIGGLLLGAFFMATDYSTSPTTPLGQIIMGLGCGLITFVIRIWGGYPEGVCYAILLMNLVVPLIDRFTKPKVFGHVKEVKKIA